MFRLNNQYSSLRDTILTPPNDTDELIKFIQFLDDTRNNVLPGLEKKTLEIFSCQMFLLDYYSFTKNELKPNSTTFQWVKNIHKLIFYSEKTIKEKTKSFKEDLIKRIKIFNKELIIYKSELDEFPPLGDINDIQIYAKKSQNLNDKLTNALDTIDEFNRLERYYGMKESVYPLRKLVNI